LGFSTLATGLATSSGLGLTTGSGLGLATGLAPAFGLGLDSTAFGLGFGFGFDLAFSTLSLGSGLFFTFAFTFTDFTVPTFPFAPISNPLNLFTSFVFSFPPKRQTFIKTSTSVLGNWRRPMWSEKPL
jgi:hypothetical protein